MEKFVDSFPDIMSYHGITISILIVHMHIDDDIVCVCHEQKTPKYFFPRSTSKVSFFAICQCFVVLSVCCCYTKSFACFRLSEIHISLETRRICHVMLVVSQFCSHHRQLSISRLTKPPSIAPLTLASTFSSVDEAMHSVWRCQCRFYHLLPLFPLYISSFPHMRIHNEWNCNLFQLSHISSISKQSTQASHSYYPLHPPPSSHKSTRS